jgi:hypothetical protein
VVFLTIKYEGEQKMVRVARFVFITLILILPAVALAGPAEDANAVVDRWSASYSGNDPENVAKNYWPDAILLGTVSPVMSEGTEAIVTYFTPLKGSGNKNTIDERRTIVINDNAVVVTFLYFYSDGRWQTSSGAIAIYHACHQARR